MGYSGRYLHDLKNRGVSDIFAVVLDYLGMERVEIGIINDPDLCASDVELQACRRSVGVYYQ